MRVLLLCCLLVTTTWGADFTPDPHTVQRYGPAYRYPQAGWIVVHIEGKPYERGYQHGRLLASEIAAYLRCFAAQQEPKNPSGGWTNTRRLTNALFLRKFDREYLDEMQGIADGAAAAGAKFDERKLDLIDIVALNVWAEIDSLDSALDAWPTGLEGVKFPHGQPKAMPATKSEHCSAFVATGPATADGKIVLGHITMFGLYPARFYNVWLDIKPEKGQRVAMQSYPGGIQSGMDYYMNDAGLIVTETTIAQTSFDRDGLPLTNRIRKALQYGTSIDDVVKILKEGNNGLYTNEWLLADTKTNEIAMFELGTKVSRLWRSSKGEWFGGTEGFYWGCNNTKDIELRLETLPSVVDRPHDVAWNPSRRDKKWLQFYAENKGKIDAQLGQRIFSTPPICARSSLDAKITTTVMAKEMKTLAVFGPPVGGTWYPKDEDKADYPEIVPLVPNDWTTLHLNAPVAKGSTTAVDLPLQAVPFLPESERYPSPLPETKPAWHGTLLAKTDADIWLTSGFAAYERLVALEQTFRAEHEGALLVEDHERLGLEYALHRAQWLYGKDLKAAPNAGADVTRDHWLKAQTARGVMVFEQLRQELGLTKFIALMDEFGRQHAGKTVTSATLMEFIRARHKADSPAFKAPATDVQGTTFTLNSWQLDMDHVVIVYGTKGDRVANRETAELLQKAIQKANWNYVLPLLSDDQAITQQPEAHYLLIGGPTTNKLSEQWQTTFPVQWTAGTFQVLKERYAHMNSAVVAVGTQAKNSRYSAVVFAGLSAEATQFATARFLKNDWRGATVLVLPHGGKFKVLAPPVNVLSN